MKNKKGIECAEYPNTSKVPAKLVNGICVQPTEHKEICVQQNAVSPDAKESEGKK